MKHEYQLITQDNAVLTAAVSAVTPIAAPVPNIVAEADAAAEDVAASEAAAAPAVSAPVVPNIAVVAAVELIAAAIAPCNAAN